MAASVAVVEGRNMSFGNLRPLSLLFALVAACGTEGPPGLAGPRGENGAQGDPGPGGPVGDSGVATGDASAPLRPLMPVWRDANGTVMPVVNVKHSLGAFEDLVDVWIQATNGVIWALGVEGPAAVVNHLDLAYKTADCTGDAYTLAIPAMFSFRDDSEPTVSVKYYPPNVTVEDFYPESVRRVYGQCTQSQRYSSQRVKFSDAILVARPTFGFKPPYRVRME